MSISEWYDHGSYPSNGAAGSSSAMRSELEAIQDGLSAKLPDLSGNGGEIVAVNSGATALEAITTTGTGSGVRATSPTLVTPVLGVATATSINKNSFTTPATSCTWTLVDGKTFTCSNTLTLAGTDGSTLNVGTGGTLGTAAYTASSDYGLVASPLSQFAATTSAQLRGVISDETGSGSLVFSTSPTLTTPTIGVATATSVNKVAITAPATSATLTIADGKTLTVNRTLTLTGTDSTTMTFPSTSATIARTDAANTFTGLQTFSTGITSTAAANSFGLSTVTDNSSSTALTVTQAGSGDVFAALDSSGDTTVFAVDATGTVRIQLAANYATGAALNIPVAGSSTGAITTNAGTTSTRTHWRLSVSDAEVGGIGTQNGDMTVLVGGTERLRIASDGTLSHRATATIIVDASSHLGLRSYTVATLPSAATAARLIYVSDGTSNKRLAVSDGTNWRWPDGAIVS